MFIKSILLGVLFLLASHLVGASEFEKTIDSLYTIALENNTDLKSTESAHLSSLFDSYAAGALPDPTVSLAAVNLPKSSLALDKTPMSGIIVGLGQKLPWPGKLKSKGAIAGYTADIVEQKIDDLKNMIALNLNRAYSGYAFWSLASVIIDENLIIFDQIIASVESDYANGIKPAHDYLSALTAKDRLSIMKIEHDEQIEKSLLVIAELLNSPASRNSLPAHMPTSEIDNDNLPGEDLSNNPQLMIAELEIEKSNHSLSLAKSEYWPDFKVGVDYRFRKEVPGDPVKGEDYLTFKIGFDLPLWYFKSHKNKTASAKHRQNSKSHKYESIEVNLLQKYRKVRLTIGTIAASIEKYEQGMIINAEAAFEAALVSYEVGDIDFGQLAGALLNLSELRINRLKFYKKYYESIAELHYLTGNKYGIEEN